jgi:enoyl-CoA hydratase/carnithine racemase
MPQFAKPPPKIEDDVVQLEFPAEHILSIKMNRPKAFNAMNNALNNALEDVFNWFESEPSLWVAILGSTNPKAWCAGMDLKQVVSARWPG